MSLTDEQIRTIGAVFMAHRAWAEGAQTEEEWHVLLLETGGYLVRILVAVDGMEPAAGAAKVGLLIPDAEFKRLLSLELDSVVERRAESTEALN